MEFLTVILVGTLVLMGAHFVTVLTLRSKQ